MEPERYLRELVNERIQQLNDAGPDVASGLSSSFMREINAVSEALVATGNQPDEFAIRGVARAFADDLERRGFLTRMTMQSSMSMGVAARAAGPRPGPRREEPRREPKIVAVVPLVREIGWIAEHRVTTLSLELWSESMLLRFVLTRPERVAFGERRGRWLQPVGWEVEDDIGTGYARTGRSGHGGGMLFVSEESFQPTPPRNAQNLTLIARHVINDPARDEPRMPGNETLGDEITRFQVPLPSH